MGSITPKEVRIWLKDLGYIPTTGHDDGLDVLCDRKLHAFWSFMLTRVKNCEEVQRVRSVLQANQSRGADLQTDKREQDSLDRHHASVDREIVAIRQELKEEETALKLHTDLLLEEQQGQQRQRTCEGAAASQVLLLEAYSERVRKLNSAVQESVTELQRLVNPSSANREPYASSCSKGASKDMVEQSHAAISSHLNSNLGWQPSLIQNSLQSFPAVHMLLEGQLGTFRQVLLEDLTEMSCLATQKLREEISGLDLSAEAELVQLQGGKPNSGVPDVSSLLKSRQKAHVEEFMESEAANQTGDDALEELEGFMNTIRRQMDGTIVSQLRSHLLELLVDTAGAKAVVCFLEEQLETLTKQYEGKLDLEAQLRRKMNQIKDFDKRNKEMDDHIQNMHRHVLILMRNWDESTSVVRAFLTSKLLPALASLTKTCKDSMDVPSNEVTAFQSLNLLDVSLGPAQQKKGGVAEDPDPVLQQFDAAQQRRAQASPGPASRTPALDQVLQRLARTNPAVSFQAPDSILADLLSSQKSLGTHGGLEQGWRAGLLDAEATSSKLASLTGDAEQAMQALLQDVSSCEQQLAETCKEAREAVAFAENEVVTAMEEWWKLPAVDAAPWLKYEGKNAGEWLAQIRMLHAAQSAGYR